MVSQQVGGIGLTVLVLVTGPALAEPVRSVPLAAPASNIAPIDTRSAVAPAMPIPPVPSSKPPRAFLSAARDALTRGRTGETREALERAESRLLDRAVEPARADAPDTARAVRDIGIARRDLAARDRAGAARAIDDALDALSSPTAHVAAAAAALPIPLPPPPLSLPVPVSLTTVAPPPVPTATYVLLPGHWELHGANWAWVPPDTVLRPVEAHASVQGENVWRDGRWLWVPAHFVR